LELGLEPADREVLAHRKQRLVTNFMAVHGSVHRGSMSIIVQQDVTIYSLLYFYKLLYIFLVVRVVTPPIIRSTYNCNHSICLCYLPLS